MQEIKKCPHCGGEGFVDIVEHPESNRPIYRFHGRVMCIMCQATAGTTGFDRTREDAERRAIIAWNKRVEPLETKKCKNYTNY